MRILIGFLLLVTFVAVSLAYPGPEAHPMPRGWEEGGWGGGGWGGRGWGGGGFGGYGGGWGREGGGFGGGLGLL